MLSACVAPAAGCGIGAVTYWCGFRTINFQIMTEHSFNNFSSDGQNAATSGTLRHGSLFSGIGGFDLAAEWMGWENVFHCEWNEFGKRILNYYWPNAISYDDITKTDFSIHRGKIDILTGGFPCQPYSSAGKRLGTEDDRHLWPEMLRAIREIKPKYIVGENVFGIINWNAGLVFNEVQTDLENEGYKVQPCVLPACAVNAPHRRDRVWFVAYANECTTGPSRTSGKAKSNGSKNNDEQSSRGKQTEQRIGCSDVLRADNYTKSQPGERLQSEQREISQQKQRELGGNGCKVESKRNATNPECKRQQEQGQPKRPVHTKTDSEWKASWAYDDGRWPIESPICSGDDGFSEQLDGITFPKWRQESIKAYGNAIVPQVAYQIFKALMITESKARERKIIKTDLEHEPSSLAQS
jgi:DNA (cytosine-5)-methyltransferase 1